MQRVIRNRTVVKEEQVADFNKIVQDMLIAPTGDQLDELGKLLIYNFPKCKPWLQWWMRGDISGMDESS